MASCYSSNKPPLQPKQQKKVVSHEHSCLLLELCGELAPCPASRDHQAPWHLPSLHQPKALLPPLIKTQMKTQSPQCNQDHLPCQGPQVNCICKGPPARRLAHSQAGAYGCGHPHHPAPHSDYPPDPGPGHNSCPCWLPANLPCGQTSPGFTLYVKAALPSLLFCFFLL